MMADQVPGGYNGKILRINLSSGNTSVEMLSERFCRHYIGGAGFVTYYLWKELSRGVDPLGPDNKLIFALGPVTGVALPGSGRHCVGAKSPQTGGIAKSEVGEFWGAELKRAGFDAVIIEGKAEKPVYLWVSNDKVQIKDASHIWGKTTGDTQKAIRAELGDEHVRCALIGPAGENGVRFACIMHGLYDAAGRGGLGAVMGSKNLKAVAVRGQKASTVANPDSLKEYREWMQANMRLVGDLHEFGTGSGMVAYELMGNLPVRNFRDGLFPGVKNIDARTLKDTIRVGMEGCFGCPVRCKKIVKVEEPYQVDPAYGGPEYETLAALGSNCGIDDLKAVAKGNELCGAYSLDTISTGSVIALAMECFEKGLLNTKDTGGIDLKFGNKQAMIEVIELIGKKQGIGELLAGGSAYVAQKLDHGAQGLAVQVKGLDAGMHDPRIQPGFGLGYMINPHGADHCANMHDSVFPVGRPLKEFRPLGIYEAPPLDDIGPRKVALFKQLQLKRSVQDCLVICQLFPYWIDQLAEITAAVTGWDTGVVEQMKAAERILTVARLFNIREGLTAADDKLPKRFFQPKTDGVLANKALDPAKMEKAKSYYYTLMGWDPHTGVPMPEKLEELGIA